MKKKLVLSFLVLVFFSELLFSVDTRHATPSPEPGIFSVSQMITFAKPEGTRLLVSVDNGPFEENVAPIFLSVKDGTERRFNVKTQLLSLLPSSPIIEAKDFSWVIDRKSPGVPSLVSNASGEGRTVILNLAEPDEIHFQIYHPFSGAFASGMVSPGSSLYLPEGATLCAWAVDGAGNRGAAVSSSRPSAAEHVPFRVISPVSGNWANPQMLVVDKDPDAEVYYSVDGSDPAVSGLDYTGPVLFSDTSINNVRFLAISSSGKKYIDQVYFSVNASSINPVSSLSPDGSLVETGEFMELHMDDGFSCSTGNSVTQDSAVKELIFSAVRGMRIYFPVTVTDGTLTWRWICASGEDSVPFETETETAASDPASAAPVVSILDWYFVDIGYSLPIYYSVDNSAWSLCDKPVFVDRTANHVLSWYSDSWKGAEVQKVALPAKPEIKGIPSMALTAIPLFLSDQESPYTLYYRGSTRFVPDEPDVGSAELGSGLLVELPKGIESAFSFRFLAVYEGLVHGEIDSSFTIDRKPPRTPNLDLPSESVYSRTPVTVTPAGEDEIKVSISGEPYSIVNHSITLEGDPAKNIDYTITLFAVDRAGNRSPSTVRKVSVNLDALFVDASMDVSAKRDGSPSAPFDTLDAALDTIRGSGKWRVYVKGKAPLSKTHTITADVTIIGDGAEITQNPLASIVLKEGALSVSGCTFQSLAAKGGTGSYVPKNGLPLFDLGAGNFYLVNSELAGSGNSTASLLKSNGTNITIRDSVLSLETSEYASLIDSKNSVLHMASSRMTVSARNASAISLTSSTAELSNCTVDVFTVAAARAIENWNSECGLMSGTLTRHTVTEQNLNTPSAFDTTVNEIPNKDTAVWFDSKSRMTTDGTVKIEGFWRKSEQGK